MPIRARLTLAFAASMALVLAGLGSYLYWQLGAALLHSVDLDLRSRADVVVAAVTDSQLSQVSDGPRMIDPDESFAQVLGSDATIIDSSPAVAAQPLLPAAALPAITGTSFVTRHVAGISDLARLLAVPVTAASGRVVVVVGTNLGDRADALHRLLILLAVGIPTTVVLTAGIGWLVAGAALRPVEQALERERRFLDEASHDLRTPLAVLKAELDVTLSRPRTAAELDTALRSAAGDTNRLVALTENLLVVARTRAGPLGLHLEDVALQTLLHDAASPFQRTHNVVVDAPDEGVHVDPLRVGQAVRNLIDNAVRHGGPGPVHVSATRADQTVRIAVTDIGPGFPAWLTDGDTHRFGLGLRIVQAVADSHGGRLTFHTGTAGGARAELTVPG